MENTIIDILQTLGLPVALIIWYLFIERPRQEQAKATDIERHDKLVDKIIEGNKECSDKLQLAMSESSRSIQDNTVVIKELKELIDSRIK